MNRPTSLLIALACCANTFAQQFELDWAEPIGAASRKIKVASNGDVVSLSYTWGDPFELRRMTPGGATIWTITWPEPSQANVDMDMDGNDNIYLHFGFNGQLDLDPGPDSTVIGSGHAYAKYDGGGQFIWGFGITGAFIASDENTSAISCDDAGNLYVIGTMSGPGTIDLDPGAGVEDFTMGQFIQVSYVARYLPDGTFSWGVAYVGAFQGDGILTRDVAALRDGSGFFLLYRFANSCLPFDADLGPGTYITGACEHHLLRYDSTLQFVAYGGVYYLLGRLACDAAGSAYVNGLPPSSNHTTTSKYVQNGTAMDLVYDAHHEIGNAEYGDVVADEQGGCFAAYSIWDQFSGSLRAVHVDPVGTIDLDLSLPKGANNSDTRCAAIALDGGHLYIGTSVAYNAVDYDPGPGTMIFAFADGVVARYAWCDSVPADPLGITVSAPLCAGSIATLTADGVGAADSYLWSVPPGFTIIGPDSTATIQLALTFAGAAQVSVQALNGCGASAPVSTTLNITDTPVPNLGPDQVLCIGNSLTLDAGWPGGSYAWSPSNGETTQTLSVTQLATTTYTVEVNVAGCIGTDDITIVVDPCLGLNEATAGVIALWPDPVGQGQVLHVQGVRANELLRLIGVDGRAWPMRIMANDATVTLATDHLPSGLFLLELADGRSARFMITR